MKSFRKVIGGRKNSSAKGRNLFEDDNRRNGFRRKLECKAKDFIPGVTLGTGTFGRVRLAEFTRADEIEHASRFYALKVLKKSEILRLKQVAHIKNETIILSQIEHPFIVTLVNHYQDDYKITMVLEFVSGGELFSLLRDQHQLSNEDARFYAGQVLLALGYLHAKRIAYRDLKPENLLLDREGYLRIADFGFAKQIDQRTWTVCGTPEYLAPEIIQSKGHGCAVDWWAFGILIYEMLAGQPPFVDDSQFGIYQGILKGQVDYPRHFDAKAVSLIKSLLKADLTKRLGCLKGGPEEIQNTKWFHKMDLELLYDRVITAPHIPNVTSEDDTSAFDPYDESPPGSCKSISKSDALQFEDFDHIGYKATP